MKKKRKKTEIKISIEEYIKAVKKADRENELSHHSGWKRITSIHKSKKIYTRKNKGKDFAQE